MDATVQCPPVTIRQSRAKLLLRLGLWLVLAVGLVLTLFVRQTVPFHYFETGTHATGVLLYGALFLFTALSGFAILSILHPAVLKLEPSGITCTSMWGVTQLGWNDVDQFFIRGASAGDEVVLYNLSQLYLWKHRRIRTPLGSFGRGWEKSPRELVEMLRRAKSQWGEDLSPRGRSLAFVSNAH